MNALWTSVDAVAATGGRSTADWQATGVSIDTRSLRPGDLFVALKDVRDGHDFVADALRKGAAAALVSRIPEDVEPDAPLLVVGDVLKGLEDLARAGRHRSRARVVAVTGSVGKTSTKEMLRAVLSGQGTVHAAEKSFNNHWGVPLTLARLAPGTDFAVIEVGMNHPGEIAPLARIARPHVAVITTVAPAHLEAFDGIEAIAHEKAAIFEGLEDGGIAIINADIPTAPILAVKAQESGATLIRFGASRDAEFQLVDATIARDATVVRAERDGKPILFKIMTPGRHFALNALAVLAVAEALGADPALAACDLATWMPPAGRGTRERIVLDLVDDHLAVDLIDDAFNANPASMAASLDVLSAAQPEDGVGRVARGRRIAVLGDMLELGPDETRLHANLAAHPAMANIATVHCVGPRMRALHQALPRNQRGRWVEQADDLALAVHGLLDAGDVVLVKGSKSSRVSVIVDAIRKLGHVRTAEAQGNE